MKVWITHDNGRPALGALPDDIELEVYDGGADFPSDPAGVEFWVPSFLSRAITTERLRAMTGLRVIQLLSAGADAWIDHVPPRVTLCDAMGVHTDSTAEWTVTAMLASLRGFDHFARAQSRRHWDKYVADTLSGKRVLIVGAGDIGAAVAKRVRVFDAEPVLVARRARDGVHAATELPKLLPEADVVVILVPLTGQTRGMVDAGFLSRMRDGALLVNAARGPIVDTDALVAETRTGRLRAALDVTEPEPLPEDNPLWEFPNVLITPHVGGAVPGFTDRAYRLVGRQLRRYAAGEPLANVVRDGY